VCVSVCVCVCVCVCVRVCVCVEGYMRVTYLAADADLGARVFRVEPLLANLRIGRGEAADAT
jgi:hypothetical protein